eukprot:TRINITY_DN33104_c0_g1_i1.p1 TRINITY_DN33104_c0_g1~~TRINITY_DN33104_c0_g1_i1.p1  ORF type:complete len:219 (-),score=24.30 TRINITY_DN33104_c0_g1_i1:236-892(-)
MSDGGLVVAALFAGLVVGALIAWIITRRCYLQHIQFISERKVAAQGGGWRISCKHGEVGSPPLTPSKAYTPQRAAPLQVVTPLSPFGSMASKLRSSKCVPIQQANLSSYPLNREDCLTVDIAVGDRTLGSDSDKENCKPSFILDEESCQNLDEDWKEIMEEIIGKVNVHNPRIQLNQVDVVELVLQSPVQLSREETIQSVIQRILKQYRQPTLKYQQN